MLFLPFSYNSSFITIHNVVAARLCFHRHLSFCSQGEGRGCDRHPTSRPPGRHPFQADPLGRHPSRYAPWADTPWSDTPWPDTPCPVHAGMHTLPAQCMLGYTPLPSACWQPLHQMICILLECILVQLMISVHRHFCCIFIMF